MLNRLYQYILSIPKTIYFNFRYLPLKKAWRLPIVVSHKVILNVMDGSISYNGPLKLANIRIGFGIMNGLFDKDLSRSIWTCKGIVEFQGSAYIGHGCKIEVRENAVLTIGNNLDITAETQIYCRKKITFGENVLISWQCLIMDSDHHKILHNGIITNKDKAIWIGDNVWIACRSTILKGSKIPKGCIVAANSNVAGQFSEECVLIAGVPAKITKHNIVWKR